NERGPRPSDRGYHRMHCAAQSSLQVCPSPEDAIVKAVHLDLDAAWPDDVLDVPRVDLRAWASKLRYVARRDDIEEFWEAVKGGVSPFLVYGSGDFHHLAGLFLRRINGDPVTVISFDNHP